MRDYTWQMFEVTGDVEAYLLYRAYEIHSGQTEENLVEEPSGEEDAREPFM